MSKLQLARRARFMVARSGPDVVGELLNAQGRVIASHPHFRGVGLSSSKP